MATNSEIRCKCIATLADGTHWQFADRGQPCFATASAQGLLVLKILLCCTRSYNLHIENLKFLFKLETKDEKGNVSMSGTV